MTMWIRVMFIEPSVDDDDELLLCLLNCWLSCWSSGRGVHVNDSTGERQYALRWLETMAVRREQLYYRFTHLSLRIDHYGHLKAMRQKESYWH